jgi:hypothetical protein
MVFLPPVVVLTGQKVDGTATTRAGRVVGWVVGKRRERTGSDVEITVSITLRLPCVPEVLSASINLLKVLSASHPQRIS